MLEVLLGLYILFRYKASTVTKIIAGMLGLLAVFQLAEYIVCVQGSFVWSRIGYAAITMLPPLGLHLAYAISGRKGSGAVRAGYAAGAAIALVFALVPTSINSAVCTGNYVIFRVSQPYSMLYGSYYLGVLIYTLGFALYRHHAESVKPALQWLVYGYLAFIIPSALISANWSQTRDAMPSIMCGFALIFAFILTGKIISLAPNQVESENYLGFIKRLQEKLRSLDPRI